MIGSSLAPVYVPAPAHGRAFRPGQPRVIVIHSIECPLGDGWANNLARNWLASPSAGVSVHYVVDPGQVVQTLDESLVGWGAGTVNSCALHIEQSGYARYTRAQWTTARGLAQLARLAALVRDIGSRHGIPMRWLTDAGLRAAYDGTGPGGLATHDDCRRVLGGTTHTDPGPGYPRDLLLDAIQPASAEGQRHSPIEEDDDMPLSDDDLNKVAARLRQPDVGNAIALRWFTTDLAGTDGTAGAVLANIWSTSRSASAAAIKAAAQSAATVPGATAQSVADAVVRTLGEHLT